MLRALRVAPLVSLCLLCALGWPHPAGAEYIVEGTIDGDTFNHSITSRFSESPLAVPLNGVEYRDSNTISSGASGGAESSFQIYATGEPGHVGLKSTAIANATATEGTSVNVFITARTFATQTIQIKGSDTRPVTVHAKVNFEGSLSSAVARLGEGSVRFTPSTSTNIDITSTAPVGGTWGLSDHVCCVDGQVSDVEYPLVPSISIEYKMTPGVQNVISYGLTLDTLAVGGLALNAYGGSASATGDLLDTAAWGGITEVTDADGNQIVDTDWSITTPDNFDYRNPFGQPPAVPEPPSAVLLLSALGGFCAVRGGASRRDRVPGR